MAFDKIDTRCLECVLTRCAVPDKVAKIVLQMTEGPEFQVAMVGRTSQMKKQETGIRQGCTLSPFLFTLILSAIMQDVGDEMARTHPLAITPTMDLDNADDTVLMARAAETASAILACTEREAAKYGMKLNRGKVKRLAHGSDAHIVYADGTAVPRHATVE